MPVGDILEARVACFLTDQASYNVRHYVVAEIVGAEQGPEVLAGVLDSNLSVVYKALLAIEALYIGVGVRRVIPEPVGAEFISTANTGPGLWAGGPLPRQAAGLISLRSAGPGRRGRGRVYVPFPAEDANESPGVPTAGYINTLAALRDALVGPAVSAAGPNTTTWVPVVYSRTAAAAFSVLAGFTRLTWATQRRRGSFGRANLIPFS